MKKLLLISLLFLGAVNMHAQTHFNQNYESEQIEQCRQTIGLDYSMPDYSTSKVDAKVMGPRLAKIVDKILEMCKQEINLNKIAIFQARQIDGLNYCKIKKLQLKEVTKRGNEISVVFKTTLDTNVKNIKQAQLTFKFVDGVSDDMATNDYFSSVCRYIKE